MTARAGRRRASAGARAGPDFDAIVVAGGAARRFGGVNKCALMVGGRAVLARVTDALAAARCVVVVGTTVPGARADVVTHEEPMGGGPVAALAAGLRFVRAPLVVVVGGDMPALTTEAIAHLVHSVAGVDRAVAVDDTGREQFLCAAWRTAALSSTLASLDPVGAALRSVVPERDRRVVLPGEPPPWSDCDTPAQLAALRLALDRSSGRGGAAVVGDTGHDTGHDTGDGASTRGVSAG